MPFFKKRLNNEQKRLLGRKLLLAREKPDDIFELSGIGLYEVPDGTYSQCKVFRKKALFLQNNRLENLKGGGVLSDLCDIKIIDLSHNKFSKLDKDFGLLTDVKRVDLSYNNLKSLPDTIGNLKELEVLNLRGNFLSSLPESIKKLKHLHTLDLRDNKHLNHLTNELCYLSELTELLFDPSTIVYPPEEITSKGVNEIRRWLSLVLGEEFDAATDGKIVIRPDTSNGKHTLDEIKVLENESSQFEEEIRQLEKEKENRLRQRMELERQILEAQEENARLAHEAKDQRDRASAQIAHDELENQCEIVKRYQEIEADRKKLIEQIETENNLLNDTVCLVLEMSDRARLTDSLLEKLEEDRLRTEELVKITTAEAERLQKEDVLNAMAFLLKEEEKYKKTWGELLDSENKATADAVLRSSANEEQAIEAVLDQQDQENEQIMNRIITEDEAQMRAVRILLSQKDNKLTRIRKQIEMIEGELVRLTHLEKERSKETSDQELKTLAEMRMNTAMLLCTLRDEREKREEQLTDRLLEMEKMREDEVKDFWLVQYQRLLDSKPQLLVDAENQLEMFVIDTLLNAGAKEYLPLFARRGITRTQLIAMKDKDLKELGIHNELLRQEILAAVKSSLLMEERTERAGASMVNTKLMDYTLAPSAPSLEDTMTSAFGNECVVSLGQKVNLRLTDNTPAPSAPPAEDNIAPALAQHECVICMDQQTEMIFIPCGHVCVCFDCGKSLELCPLCRQVITQKCRLYCV